MSLLADVLRESRDGARPGAIAARLGVDPGLVEAAIDHWVRLGEISTVTQLGLGCSGCAPGAGCSGCPVASTGPVPVQLRVRQVDRPA